MKFPWSRPAPRASEQTKRALALLQALTQPADTRISPVPRIHYVDEGPEALLTMPEKIKNPDEWFWVSPTYELLPPDVPIQVLLVYQDRPEHPAPELPCPLHLLTRTQAGGARDDWEIFVHAQKITGTDRPIAFDSVTASALPEPLREGIGSYAPCIAVRLPMGRFQIIMLSRGLATCGGHLPAFIEKLENCIKRGKLHWDVVDTTRPRDADTKTTRPPPAPST